LGTTNFQLPHPIWELGELLGNPKKTKNPFFTKEDIRGLMMA
jgi:hypothetical protein